MTTIVGIKAEKGVEGIVLASDLAGTREEWQARGDIAVRKQSQSETQKIYVDEKQEAAISMTGVLDSAYQKFLVQMLKGDINLKKALQNDEKIFPELLSLSLSRWGNMEANDYRNSLLIATRFNKKPQLYSCWPLGKVVPTDGIAIGSGSQYAIEYIANLGKLIPYEVSIEDAIEMTSKALERASSQDLYTRGLDIVVVTAGGIHSYGDTIKEKVDAAMDSAIDGIKADIAAKKKR
ncbi:MAG: hypothetical protein ABIE22_04745 [archaeon]